MAVLVHREVQQKEPASAGLYRRCRFVSASRGAQPSGQSIAIEAGENLRRGVPAHDFDLLDCRRSASCIRNHKLVDEVQLMVRSLNGKRSGAQRRRNHGSQGVLGSSRKRHHYRRAGRTKAEKKPSGTHKPRFRNTDSRWQDRISVHYRIAVRFYPVS